MLAPLLYTPIYSNNIKFFRLFSSNSEFYGIIPFIIQATNSVKLSFIAEYHPLLPTNVVRTVLNFGAAINLSIQLPIVALGSFYLTNQLIGKKKSSKRYCAFPTINRISSISLVLKIPFFLLQARSLPSNKFDKANQHVLSPQHAFN